MKKLLLSLALVLLCPVLSPGWGFFAHRIIHQVAVYELPANMQPFYFRHMKELVRLASAADERRSDDPEEEHKHYIDMDHYGDNPFGLMPKAYDKAVAKYTADTLKKYGTLPWTILDTQERLANAFSDGDTLAIIRLSADLGHYVSDAFVPLHTTENYDGQMTNQQGLHSLWESKLPERHIAEYKLAGAPGEYLKDPMTSVWKTIQESYGFLGATFDYENEISKKFPADKKYVYSHRYGKTRRSYSDAFADEYHKKVGGMVAYRMKLAPTLVASLWLTAWREGGSPDLNALMKPNKLSKDEKSALDAQLAAFKKNTLVDQTMLLAMVKQQAVEKPDVVGSADGAAAPPPAPAAPEPAPQTDKVKLVQKKDGDKKKVKVKKEEAKTDGAFGD